MKKLLCALLLFANPVWADGERAGEFDYYVLSLSWTPNWCALEGDARSSEQCLADKGFGFTLHGLWPQYEQGWPSYCKSSFSNPSRADTAAMADIMGTSGLAWHQWNKHGRCSGLSSDGYYALSRKAYEKVKRSSLLRALEHPIDVAPMVIEAAFLEENPDLEADEITITCKSSRIQEARICLTKDLEFRTCGRDVIKDCTLDTAEFLPMR